MRRLPLLAFMLALACDKPAPTTEPQPTKVEPTPEPVTMPALDDYALIAPGVDAATLRKKVDQFAPVVLEADLSHLPESERQVVAKLIEASRLLDPVFDRQVWAGYPRHHERLVAAAAEGGELERLTLDYFEIMRGPWDRQDHFAPFAIDIPHPQGAGFYPPGLTAQDFASVVDQNPSATLLSSGFSVIQRDTSDPTKLIAIPYSQAYREWLEPAAQLLEEAAALTSNPSLATFLRSRAAAFRSDDYYQSDKDWMDLDSVVEITIGPYETYEDELRGLKTSFESFVTVADPEASKKLAVYKDWLPKMEQNLPVPKAVKTKRGAESPIRVVDLVFTSGDARKSVQTIAFNLPNDERVRAEKGAKKVMLRNAINAKYVAIMQPIAAQVLSAEQLPRLSQQAFFDEVLFHELSHSLGPAMTKDAQGNAVEIRVALGSSYAPLEEGKADVMGVWNLLFMLAKQPKLFPKDYRDAVLITYFAGLFRSARFGVAEAHGKGAAYQINYYLEQGAASFDAASGTFAVDTAKLAKAVESLTHDVVMLQHEGDVSKVEAFLAKYGVVSQPMQAALAKLDAIPVDIRPRYPVAGE